MIWELYLLILYVNIQLAVSWFVFKINHDIKYYE